MKWYNIIKQKAIKIHIQEIEYTISTHILPLPLMSSYVFPFLSLLFLPLSLPLCSLLSYSHLPAFMPLLPFSSVPLLSSLFPPFPFLSPSLSSQLSCLSFPFPQFSSLLSLPSLSLLDISLILLSLLSGKISLLFLSLSSWLHILLYPLSSLPFSHISFFPSLSLLSA